MRRSEVAIRRSKAGGWNSAPLKAQKYVQRCRHPIEEASPPEAKGHEPQQVRQQVIRTAVPAIGRAFQNPAHDVYASARTNRPTAASNRKQVTTKSMAAIRRVA